MLQLWVCVCVYIQMVAELLIAYNKLCALGMVVVMDLLHGTDCVCVCVCACTCGL